MVRLRRTGSALRLLRIASLVCLASLVSGSSTGALAADQPDQLISGHKVVVKTKVGDPSKAKLVVSSKDGSFDLPNPQNDPTQGGATLHIVDLGRPGAPLSLSLPAADWATVGAGLKYSGAAGAPCKSVKIVDGKLIKIVCKGANVDVPIPFVGDLAISLVLGSSSIRYCATFGGTTIRNQEKGGKGRLVAKEAAAPAVCLSCGDGVVDAGEDCDGGGDVAGDCCDARCRFDAAGSTCDDGDACTQSTVCDATGGCAGSTVCGNGTHEAECGEQCDASDDTNCQNRCLPDCTCAPEPVCLSDPTRTIFAGGPQTGACARFEGDEALCEQAYHLGGGGVSSCFYDADSEGCMGCGPTNQMEGRCLNTCDPPVCVADPSRTIFAGGPGTSACHLFDEDQGSCEQAFHIGDGGVASCYYDVDAQECRGCGSGNIAQGLCTNSCASCAEDPTRTIFAGGPNSGACHQFDGDPASCEQAFHRGQCRSEVSCFYDSSSGECSGCGPANELDGRCQNTCEQGPFGCTNDPARTVFAGGPGTAACHQFDGDPAACVEAFHATSCNEASSCYYDFSSEVCNGCGPNNLTDGRCVNTCASGPVTCPDDASRTIFAGMPESSACRRLGESGGTVACEQGFHIGRSGVASCYDSGGVCRGCGPANEASGECANTCVGGPPSCEDDPTRTVFAGGPGTGACQQFADQASCESAFHEGNCGTASCYWDGGCAGCGPTNRMNGLCTNTCDAPACDGDPSRTIFAGGPETGACHFFDEDPTNCLRAYHVGAAGVASCWYDGETGSCNGCGPNNLDAGLCANTCPVCEQDPSRTTFTGGADSDACNRFDLDPAACEAAFQLDECLNETACFFDVDADECRACLPDDLADGLCRNTCERGPARCENDPSRTVFAGGPGSMACGQFDGDVIACHRAFHTGQSGTASCFYTANEGTCRGCGPSSQQNGVCRNTCVHGPPSCERDPGRLIFAGGPGSGACQQFAGDPAACESAFHFDQCFQGTSCFYDHDGGECFGCGINNQQSGLCVDTCVHGPAECTLDPSRIFVTPASDTFDCTDIDDRATCLAAATGTQCGIVSCYWRSGCENCGPEQEFSECFNTCRAP